MRVSLAVGSPGLCLRRIGVAEQPDQGVDVLERGWSPSPRCGLMSGCITWCTRCCTPRPVRPLDRARRPSGMGVPLSATKLVPELHWPLRGPGSCSLRELRPGWRWLRGASAGVALASGSFCGLGLVLLLRGLLGRGGVGFGGFGRGGVGLGGFGRGWRWLPGLLRGRAAAHWSPPPWKPRCSPFRSRRAARPIIAAAPVSWCRRVRRASPSKIMVSGRPGMTSPDAAAVPPAARHSRNGSARARPDARRRRWKSTQPRQHEP